MYKKLVQGLCNEHQIPLITVDDNKKLGEWAGLCKIDNTGKARKIVGCSCVVIRVSLTFPLFYLSLNVPKSWSMITNALDYFQDWGEETPHLDALKDHLKTIGTI